MNYAIISGDIITSHGRAAKLWPETSFAAGCPNESFLADAGAVLIRSNAVFNPETEYLKTSEPYILNGEVFNMIPVQIEPTSLETLAEMGRMERDRLLSESDWTQLADAPIEQTVWAIYRQALRDVPQQDEFPAVITWPQKPE